MLMKQNVNKNVSKDSSPSKTRNDSLFISSEIILSCADFIQYKYTPPLLSLLPAYKVTQRGQMHVRHLRELATKLSGLQRENAESMNYFTVKIQTLCKMALRDCCMELEGSVEGVERAALSTNPVGYLEIHRAIPKDIAQKYQQVCSSSEESIIKISKPLFLVSFKVLRKS